MHPAACCAVETNPDPDAVLGEGLPCPHGSQGALIGWSGNGCEWCWSPQGGSRGGNEIPAAAFPLQPLPPHLEPSRKSGDRRGSCLGWSCHRQGMAAASPLARGREGAVAEPPSSLPTLCSQEHGFASHQILLLSPTEEMGTFWGRRGQRWEPLWEFLL